MSRHVQIAVATVALAQVPSTLWPRLAAILSKDERARADRFHFERNWQEHVAAHALKRLMLCQAAGGVPQDWAFTVEANGKPVVCGAKGPHFNLSHCDGIVACALSPQVPVGVDVEPVGRSAPLDIADRYFAAAERAWLFGLPESERAFGFFRLWTLKEAFLKAAGSGVSEGMHDFAISFDPLRVSFPGLSRTEGGDWRLVQTMIGEGHLLALAWRGPEAGVTLEAARLEEILG